MLLDFVGRCVYVHRNQCAIVSINNGRCKQVKQPLGLLFGDPVTEHLDLVAKADYEGIADQIERSKRLWENVGLDGLVKRREEEADLILNSIA